MIRPPEPEDQQAFARAIIALLEVLEVPYAIGGSVAAMEYGEPRLTIDIDLMVSARRDQLEALVEGLGDWHLYVTPLEVISETAIPHGERWGQVLGLLDLWQGLWDRRMDRPPNHPAAA